MPPAISRTTFNLLALSLVQCRLVGVFQLAQLKVEV